MKTYKYIVYKIDKSTFLNQSSGFRPGVIHQSAYKSMRFIKYTIF